MCIICVLCVYNDNWQCFRSIYHSFVTLYLSILSPLMWVAMKMIMMFTVLKISTSNEATNYHELAKHVCKIIFGFFFKLEIFQYYRVGINLFFHCLLANLLRFWIWLILSRNYSCCSFSLLLFSFGRRKRSNFII